MIEMIKNFYSIFRPYHTLDVIMAIVMTIVAIAALTLAGVLIFCFLEWTYKTVFFDAAYDKAVTYNGEVTDMEYVPPRSHVTMAGKTPITSHTPEKNVVHISSPVGREEINSDELYQRVRVGESVKIRYQNKYLRPKYWQGDWKLDEKIVISVTSEKAQTVDFSKEKETSYGY